MKKKVILLIYVAVITTICAQKLQTIHTPIIESHSFTNNDRIKIFNSCYVHENSTDKNCIKDSAIYYSASKINIYFGYNGSVDYGLSYFPFKKYKYFVNLNYQYFTSFSPTANGVEFGLLNEFGLHTLQLYYKIGLVYFLRRNVYLGANLGLGYTFPMRGNILNDILLGVRFKIKNDIYLQTEGGANNLIKFFGNEINPFIKIGVGFNY